MKLLDEEIEDNKEDSRSEIDEIESKIKELRAELESNAEHHDTCLKKTVYRGNLIMNQFQLKRWDTMFLLTRRYRA